MIFRNLKNPLLSKTFRSQIPSFGVLNHEKFQKKVEGKGKVTKFLYEFWEILYQGTWDQCVDAKLMCKYTITQKKTAFMLSEITRIRKDLIKFVPFSFFLVVPGAELLLPPYLYLFPNAFPTTYLFDDQLAKRYITRDRKQMNSYRYLFQLMKQRIPSIENIRNNQDYNAKGLQELVLKHSHLFMTKLDYREFNSEQLVHQIFRNGVFRGTYTIMKLTKLFVNLPVYFTNLFYWLTRNPERRPLKSVLKIGIPSSLFQLKIQKGIAFNVNQISSQKMERQDKAFRLNGFGDNNFDSIRQFARERGIPALVMQKENPEQHFEYSKSNLKETTQISYIKNKFLKISKFGMLFSTMRDIIIELLKNMKKELENIYYIDMFPFKIINNDFLFQSNYLIYQTVLIHLNNTKHKNAFELPKEFEIIFSYSQSFCQLYLNSI